ncbi:MAG: hypothetical protein AAF413_02570 [Patescibacteria group bacterium]
MSEFMQRPKAAATKAAAGQKTAKAAAKSADRMHIGAGVLIILGGLLAAAVLFLMLRSSGSAITTEREQIKDELYQAVFLDTADGQVFFGNLESYSSELYRLSDIYYVQVQRQIDPDTGQQQATGISLTKRGNELQGPEDIMYIQRDKVLYWENLKASGQVACAIANYQIDELGLSVSKDQGCIEREQEAATQQQQQQPATVDPATGTQPAGTPQVDDTPATPPVTPPATDDGAAQ